MEKLKKVIAEYGRWAPLTAYVERIDAHLDTDFSHALENAKSLLEAIAKEICTSHNVQLEPAASINSVLKKAFTAVGYSSSDMVTQISSALATIGQKVGDLRNEIGPTSHGMSLQELQERNDKVNIMTKEFLLDSTVLVSCFLIRTFENETPRTAAPVATKLTLVEQEEFNNYWDDTHGDFEMGEYSYPASEILYHVDYPAYTTEHKAYTENESDAE